MMSQIVQFFVNDIPQTIGIFLMIVVLLFLALQAHSKKQDVWHAIAGDDNKLQLIEVVMALWIVLFPIVVLSNLFLNRHLDPAIMISMDVILAIIVGVKQFKSASVAAKSLKEEGDSQKEK